MLPTSSSSSRSQSDDGPVTGADPSPIIGDPGAKPLGPIGPERLAELREAIRNGSYPTETDVVGGLVRMFGDRPKN